MLASLGWVIYATCHMLGKAADAISTANNEVGIKLEMQDIARSIKIDYISSARLPRNVKELVALLKTYAAQENRETTREVGKDMWGTYYRLATTDKGFYVLSAGPDRNWKTEEDNVTFHQNLTDVGYSRAQQQSTSAQGRPASARGEGMSSARPGAPRKSSRPKLSIGPRKKRRARARRRR